MLENLNGWEFVALVLLALLIFGDRLPKVISDGLRMLRNLRAMARNATGDLSRELGTDIQLEDLHPKTFIRKHLLSEAEEEALRKPLQSVYEDIRSDVKGVRAELDDVTDAVNGRRRGGSASGGAAAGAVTGGAVSGGAVSGGAVSGGAVSGGAVSGGATAETSTAAADARARAYDDAT